MKIKDLIKELEKLDGEKTINISVDPFGCNCNDIKEIVLKDVGTMQEEYVIL